MPGAVRQRQSCKVADLSESALSSQVQTTLVTDDSAGRVTCTSTRLTLITVPSRRDFSKICREAHENDRNQ
ncbi:hypothetical protein [Klebsiella pneumoniae]|uniref:hypothetical protein n=1 Tax=Klebsiella pneumoniae TaxID=573 RepID=UPI003C12F9C4